MRTWLVEIRGEISQREIATFCDITQQAYSAIEKGVTNPSIHTAKKIAKTLNFDWTKFYEENENQIV